MNRLERSVSGECWDIRTAAKHSIPILGENLSFIVLQYYGASCKKTDTIILKTLFERGEKYLIALIQPFISKHLSTFTGNLCGCEFGTVICWTCNKVHSHNPTIDHRCKCYNHLLVRNNKIISLNRDIIKAYYRVTDSTLINSKSVKRDFTTIDPLTMLYTIRSVIL